MGRSLVLGGIALSFVASAVVGCAQETEGPATEFSTASRPILDGAPATGAKYAAVGALVIEIVFPPMPEDPPGTEPFVYYDQICSGTLIADRAVVTARHCTEWIDIAAAEGGQAYFAFGEDAFAPEQRVAITGYVNAPPSPDHPGLLLNGGRDIAVAHLDSAPVGIEPAKVGLFNRHLIGRQLEVAGFGYYGQETIPDIDFQYWVYGRRFAGPATARALGGPWYSLLFGGDQQAFLDWYWTDASTGAPSDEEAAQWWEIYALEPGYELLAGGLEGESLGCYGDSGGPLFVANSAKDFTVYGVSFGVEASWANLCDHGGAYAVFNPEMRKFVQKAAKGR